MHGTYSITAHATDNNGITTVSLPANITVYAQPSLGSESYSGGNFQFTINGSAGVSVEVKASVDLVNWTSLGTVTLTGGSYNYTDTGAGSFGYRFYRVQENGVCSANIIGFITVTVPTKDAGNNSQFIALANQLNNPAGNTVDVLFPDFPKQSQVETWDANAGDYYGEWVLARKGGIPPVWNSTPALNPGPGAVVHAGGTTPLTETLVGDVPQGQQVNGFTTTLGRYYLLGSIIPRAGTLDALGFPAAEGDQIQQFVNQQWTTAATYSSSGGWSPSTPSVQVGEPFFLISGTSGTRTCTENLPACP